jgi:hypothetical protein
MSSGLTAYTTVLGQRLDRTRYHHSEVARQAVSRLSVSEGSHFWRHDRYDEVGEPFVERSRERCFV